MPGNSLQFYELPARRSAAPRSVFNFSRILRMCGRVVAPVSRRQRKQTLAGGSGAVAARRGSGGVAGEPADLPLHQLPVQAGRPHELVGLSVLNDAATLQHDDAVEVTERGQAV